MQAAMMMMMDSELLADRDVVLRILRKQREVLDGDRGREVFAQANDPRQPNLLRKIKRAKVEADRIVLEELGLDKHVKDWSKFPGLLMPVLAMYKNDQEIMNMLKYQVPKLPSMVDDVKACVLGGTLAELFHEYKNRADFLCVYLAEAHPAEYFNLNTTFKVPQHQTEDERVAAAYRLMVEDRQIHHTFTDDPLDDSRVRIVIDTMSNDFAQIYNAHPDRLFVFKEDTIIYIGNNIRKQMMNPDALMTDEARGWLVRYFQDMDGKR